MNSRNRMLLQGLAALLLLWGVVYGIVKWAGSIRPTPEKVAAFVAQHPLDEIKDSDERRRVIGDLATMLNAMEPVNWRKIPRTIRGEIFSKHLSTEEQFFFLEKRVGRAFQQMMQSFNEMDRGERKKIVERSLKRMQEQNGSPGRLEEADPEVAEKITQAGLKSYYQDASAETKIDLAPLLEEMQRSMTMMRGR